MIVDNAFIGIDVGTQGLKGVVLDARGRVHWSLTVPYPTLSPSPGWQEQEPHAWLRAYDEILQAIVQASLPVHYAGIGFTGQMHTTVVSDANGEPLRPAILWSDIRAASYGDDLEKTYGLPALMEITGNKPLSNFSLLRLLWIKEHEPQIYRRIRQVAVAKDWLRDHVTQTRRADVTDASGTYVFDVRRRKWASAWLDTLQLPQEWWGEPAESGEAVGALQRGPAALQGLPVVAGAGDQEASAVGTGLRAGRDMGISLGTSGVVFWPMTNFQSPPHPSVHAFCHADTGTWHWMSVTQSAAQSLRWYRDTFAPEASFADLDALARKSPAGSQGLQFFPYLQGERAPLMNAQARGTLMGLRPEHHAGIIIRSILEGVAFSVNHAAITMQGPESWRYDRLIATGGGAQSALWMQILADVFNHSVMVVDDPGAAVGAAWLASRHLNPQVGEIPLNVQRIIEPDADAPSYHAQFLQYQSMAEGLNRLWQGVS